MVDANPRTPHLPAEADLLRAYLERGGKKRRVGSSGFADGEGRHRDTLGHLHNRQ